MVIKYGMYDNLGLVAYEETDYSKSYSEYTN